MTFWSWDLVTAHSIVREPGYVLLLELIGLLSNTLNSLFLLSFNLQISTFSNRDETFSGLDRDSLLH